MLLLLQLGIARVRLADLVVGRPAQAHRATGEVKREGMDGSGEWRHAEEREGFE